MTIRPAAAQDAVLSGNHPANAAAVAGAVEAAPDRTLDVRVYFGLRNRPTLDRLLAAQQNPGSPVYHQWLTPDQFADRFGPLPADVEKTAYWLRDSGLNVTSASPADGYIGVAMTVAQAKRAFGVTIGASKDGTKYANLNDPVIPAEFSSVISNITGLDNLLRVEPVTLHTQRAQHPNPHSMNPAVSGQVSVPSIPDSLVRPVSYTDGAEPASPQSVGPAAKIGGETAFGPQDLSNFYDKGPLTTKGTTGAGGCIALVEDSDYLDAAVSLFDSTFSLPAGSLTRVFGSGGGSPGINGNEVEALLDIEWAHAVAPEAPIDVVIGNPGAGDIVDSMNYVANHNTCPIMSISFSFCGASKTFFTSTLDNIFSKAAVEGISTFISTGDNGSDTCKEGVPNVNEMAADPNVTAVGGTEFTPDYNGAGIDTSTVSENPGDVWDDPSPDGAGGGGASADFGKPKFQIGVTPADGARDIPDVAMIAAPGDPGVFLGNDAGGTAFMDCCWGGTSLSAPVFAALIRLTSQSAGNARYGNVDTEIYKLGPSENSSKVGLIDVTVGNNGYNGVPGANAGVGYDLASGWGSADMAEFVTAFNSTPVTVNVKLTIAPKQLSFGDVVYGTTGATSAAKNVTITNPKSSKDTVIIGTISTPAGFNQTNDCSSLAPGKSCKVSVTMRPVGFGIASGNLAIPNNTIGGTATVPLTGTGVPGKLTVTPAQLAFGKVLVGVESAAKTITLKNPNSVGLLIDSVSASADYAAAGCVGGLAAHATCKISVTFKPTSTGAHPGKVTITDDAAHSPQSVKLTGSGKS